MKSQFAVISQNSQRVLIADTGMPWDKFQTITNDAEAVVKELAPLLEGRRLFYIDSEGEEDELIVRDGEFSGFGLQPRRD
jgi:hypothetical protein